jgi:predicted metal-dependent phosphoesterase TrpH
MSPLEIAEAAKKNNVGLIAIADHDVIDGTLELRELQRKFDFKYISAVEIDTLYNNENFHILAYGLDFENDNIIKYVNEIHTLLENYSMELITNMRKDYPNVNLSEYKTFSYDVHLGGWKALHYLLEKNYTTNLKEGIRFYEKYTNSIPGYPSIHEVCEKIKQNGGYSVLAHPGELIDAKNINLFEMEIKKIISMGIDGIECYYPTHNNEVTEKCINLCKENDLLITAGSDCHGVFGKTRVGEMAVTLDQLMLKGLI